jgi:hypothetical protein
MFGVIFYLFHVDLNGQHSKINNDDSIDSKYVYNETVLDEYTSLMPGPPFVFGALMVVLAILIAAFIPEGESDIDRRPSGDKKSRYLFLLLIITTVLISKFWGPVDLIYFL